MPRLGSCLRSSHLSVISSVLPAMRAVVNGPTRLPSTLSSRCGPSAGAVVTITSTGTLTTGASKARGPVSGSYPGVHHQRVRRRRRGNSRSCERSDQLERRGEERGPSGVHLALVLVVERLGVGGLAGEEHRFGDEAGV